MSSFRACCKLLASLSEYQYTRKAWKKEAMELLLDPQFFQMDLPSLQHWKATTENLMTHDKITFKDLMAKLSSISAGGGGLSIFSSKEQELETRAQLLKRLAFVIFCSQNDQYQKQMPDIQGELTTVIRAFVICRVLRGIMKFKGQDLKNALWASALEIISSVPNSRSLWQTFSTYFAT